MNIYAKTRLQAMPRPRADMVKLIKSNQDVIQEHIWKIAAYGQIMPREVAGWVQTVRKYIPRLRLYNNKAANAFWFTSAELQQFFVNQLFGEGDIKILNYNFSEEGYPLLPTQTLPDLTLECQRLGQKFVDSIVKPRQFDV